MPNLCPPRTPTDERLFVPTSLRRAWPLCLAALISACGGSGEPNPADVVSTGTLSLQMDIAAMPSEVANEVATPFFHTAPQLMEPPADTSESSGGNAAPVHYRVDADAAGLPTGQLTVDEIKAWKQNRVARVSAAGSSSKVAPMAANSGAVVYTPAQIRSAYGLPDLPAAGTAITPAKAAQLGAGQTIYIVDAYHNPNAIAELNAFNQKFALPTCATKTIAANASLPLPAATLSTCEIAVVYNTSTGGMTTTAPAYNSGWATEISLDVQWAHAIAPLARIVLIESPDASLNSLLGGIKLANAMGPGVVSMSFGAAEGNWTASVDSVFTAPKMTYLAATGDSGMAVSWPSVSTNVLAVGGTTLSYSGPGTRSESSWSGTGGGISAYTATPSYQSNAVPGMGLSARRVVADVAMNADPASGQYTAVMSPGSTAVNWLSVGGTSLSTPQWAGLIAIANANRALASQTPLGAAHAMLYGQIATVPGTYASTFTDITRGSHGTCSTCTAKTGYDQLSGLGTPNASNLLNTLSGSSAVAAPTVPAASVNGVVGTALSFTVAVNASNPVTLTLAGAPTGMAINSAGVVTWAAPVAGTYSVVVTAKDAVTGQSGQGTYTVTIAAAKAPSLTAATITGRPAVALSFSAAATSSNPVSYTLTGAPGGMVINSAGVVSWASPVLGNYAVTVSAKDSKTGLIGKAVYTVQIANAGPVITAPAIKGTAGRALTGTINIADPGAIWLSISIAGVPVGMTFSVSGMNLIANWANPVAGSYNLKLVVTDNKGLSAQAVVPITIQ